MSSYITLILLMNDSEIQRFSIPNNEALTVIIGKGDVSDPVGIEIPGEYVSRQHASLRGDGKGYFHLQDLGSTNGTYINGRRISTHRDILLEPGMKITFTANDEYDDYVLLLEGDGAKSQVNTLLEAAVTEKSIFELLQSKDTIVIGREDDCDIVIDDETVSRKHMRVDKLPTGEFQVIDLDSTNGTYVNGERLDGQIGLDDNDDILIGDFRLSLKGVTQDIRNAMAIRAERIVKVYPNGYKGLHQTSIQVASQSLLAIMGPSGCGKSTLMKALTGDEPVTGGSIYIHDLELTQNYEYLKPRIGYVPQDDVVHKELTVEQSLYYAAKLRMENPSNEMISAKIDEILKNLGIVHIRKSVIAKISGGQRKRVSIAVELLTDPLVLFMDEPTSPLDPQTIEEFLSILRRLSEKGTTVIMVTHKPEDLMYMDSVIFMAEGGHVVFYGSTSEYKEYFGVKNTVEVYAGISGDKSRAWVTEYNTRHASDSYTQLQLRPTQTANKLKTSPFSQFYWLTLRYLRIKINDRMNSAILIAQAPIIAILLSLIFENITPALPFLISLSAIWFGTSNAAREIVGELPIYRRERMFNLLIPPYILSKLAVLSLFSTLQAVLFVIILSIRFSDSIFTEVNPVWANSFAAIAWMILLSSVATLMGLLLSSFASTTEKVMTIVPLVLIPQIILAGFITKISNWGIEIFSWFTLARWGTEGFHLTQETVYVEQTVVSTVTDARGNTTSTSQLEGSTTNAIDALNVRYLESYKDGSVFGSLTNTITLDVIAICSLGLVFFALTWVLLKRKDSLR